MIVGSDRVQDMIHYPPPKHASLEDPDDEDTRLQSSEPAALVNADAENEIEKEDLPDSPSPDEPFMPAPPVPHSPQRYCILP